ncbi:hypothetical protein SAMN05720469_12825 [Fibrobacter intestinalis]|uniref:Uncharacterized protein n=1 Tax=Fibrobacter intestinalis TaxID=28122 RepID=A0A1M6X1C6_9BACT|nr:hypothetical protein [Fibrobacter intestinalis]MDD7298670.1 hypothetical protein [Fibrobacter intestinalis]SHK99807.1 hypothetical protein SAMN05720469_12825 [Fibrobacter intestinalis]
MTINKDIPVGRHSYGESPILLEKKKAWGLCELTPFEALVNLQLA